MGYDANIYVMKKKVIDRETKKFPDVSFADLFRYRLYVYAWAGDEGSQSYYDASIGEDVEIPDDEIGRYIIWTNRHNLRRTKVLGDKYEDIKIVDHDAFVKLCDEIAVKLKSVNLFRLVDIDEDDAAELLDLVDIYKSLISENINWEEEVLVYSCG